MLLPAHFMDSEGNFRFCSQALAENTGYSHWRDMVGKKDSDIFRPSVAQDFEKDELSITTSGKPLLNQETTYCSVAFCLALNRLLARMTFCRMSRALLVQMNVLGCVLW